MADEHLAEVIRESDDECILELDIKGCFGRATNKYIPRIHVLRPGKAPWTGFYAQLLTPAEWFPDWSGFVLKFGSEICYWLVTVKGQNLRRGYDLITLHRMPAIKQVEPGRDFAKNNEPVITYIDVSDPIEPSNAFAG